MYKPLEKLQFPISTIWKCASPDSNRGYPTTMRGTHHCITYRKRSQVLIPGYSIAWLSTPSLDAILEKQIYICKVECAMLIFGCIIWSLIRQNARASAVRLAKPHHWSAHSQGNNASASFQSLRSSASIPSRYKHPLTPSLFLYPPISMSGNARDYLQSKLNGIDCGMPTV